MLPHRSTRGNIGPLAGEREPADASSAANCADRVGPPGLALDVRQAVDGSVPEGYGGDDHAVLSPPAGTQDCPNGHKDKEGGRVAGRGADTVQVDHQLMAASSRVHIPGREIRRQDLVVGPARDCSRNIVGDYVLGNCRVAVRADVKASARMHDPRDPCIAGADRRLESARHVVAGRGDAVAESASRGTSAPRLLDTTAHGGDGIRRIGDRVAVKDSDDLVSSSPRHGPCPSAHACGLIPASMVIIILGMTAGSLVARDMASAPLPR